MTRTAARKVLYLEMLILFALLGGPSRAYGGDVIFGPVTCVRVSGSPSSCEFPFSAEDPDRGFVVQVLNGGLEDDQYDKVSSSVITLNGAPILGTENFNQQVDVLEVPVALKEQNLLQVEVRGKPGGALTLEILPLIVIDYPREDHIFDAQPITVSGRVFYPATRVDINSLAGEVSGDSFSREGVPLTEGRNVILATSVTEKGFVGSDSIEVVLDTEPPKIAISYPPEGLVTKETVVPDFTVVDDLDPAPAATLSPESPYAADGVYEITLTAVDWAGNSSQATRSFTVDRVEPSITIVFPQNESTIEAARPNIEAAFSDNLSGISVADVRLFLDEVDVTSLCTVTASDVSCVPTADLYPGNHTLLLEVTDLAGNTNSRVWDFIIETGLPAGLEPLPEGSFGKQYEDLIPSDTTLDSYDPKRFSLVTGLVRDRHGNPLDGVEVSIHGRPEYGTAQTDSGGRYSLPIDGGATETLVFDSPDYLTAHRQVYVPWNDVAVAEAVTLIREDPVSTAVTFDGDPGAVAVHRSSVISDEFGSRTSTMVFTGDNRVFAVRGDGSEVELHSINTRATEYDTPESMPAKLPPNSAYTYCVNLSVDDAARVRFEKPVPVYVDNFLGFPVGMAVPVGYYDEQRAVWVPSDNGVVVRLLDTDSDGNADALDATGNGFPDDLNKNGLFADEVTGLNDGVQYAAGTSYWRFEVEHFTPWDCNWPFGPPLGSSPPNPSGEPHADQKAGEVDSCQAVNSYVEQRSRIFHEDVPLPGTDMFLHYASNRVAGYKVPINVPASGETVPENLREIIVRIEIAGKTFEQDLDPLPLQSITYVWDGRDYLGRMVAGPVKAEVAIGFVYDLVYLGPGVFQQAFAQAGTDFTAVPARQAFVSWKRSVVNIDQRISGVGSLAEGWTLSVHHQINPADPATIYRGDGAVGKNNHIKTIDALTAPGHGFSGDGGPAEYARLNYPVGVAFDGAGNTYIADSRNNRVRKIDRDGTITTFAGNGIQGYGGDGSPATEASLNWPMGVDVDGAGNIFIADYGNHCIRKVDAAGTITTVAGSGIRGFYGDEGPAMEAHFNYPSDVKVDNYGNVFIADSWNHKVRKVDANGVVTTVAGDGPGGVHGGGYYRDGGPAVAAGLENPTSIALDRSGALYIADMKNSRIRKVDTAGIITTVAGGGVSYEDNIYATEAYLRNPWGVAVGSDGSVYFPDYFHKTIRKMNTAGIITTIAGNGEYGITGDGGLATEASIFMSPSVGITTHSVAVDNVGNVYHSNGYNVRRVFTSGVLSDYVSPGDTVSFDGNGLGHVFTGEGRHSFTIDADTGAVVLTFGYDAQGRLDRVSDRFGNVTALEWDSSGHIGGVISPDGLVTALTVDGSNHLQRAGYPDGSSYEFAYTSEGLMIDEFDPNGNHFEHVFDPHGRLTEVLDPDMGHWSYGRSVKANGDVVTEVLSAEGDLTVMEDSRDSTGRYTSTTIGPDGSESSQSRSSDGMSAAKDTPCGTHVDTQYGMDSTLQKKEVRGIVQTLPGGLTKSLEKDREYSDGDEDGAADLVTDSITVNGDVWKVEHDTKTGIVTATSPLGRTTTLTYDLDLLLPREMSVPGLLPTSYGYDHRGRLADITVGSRRFSTGYDANGNLDYLVTSDDKVYYFNFDVMGRLRSELRPDGTEAVYDYDRNGNMKVLVNPTGDAYHFDYTAGNRRSRLTHPVSGSYVYSYDRDRRLTAVTAPSGRRIVNTYAEGVLDYTLTPEGVIDYGYNCGGLLEAAESGGEEVFYTYDGPLVTSDTRAGLVNQAITYSYDNFFRPVSMGYGGATVPLGYDDDGLLVSAGPYAVVHDPLNGLPTHVSGGLFSQDRRFNGYGEGEEVSSAVGGSVIYVLNVTSRDDAGRITSREERLGGVTTTWGYVYDALGRLEEVEKDGAVVESYTYDSNGNRETEANVLRGLSGRTVSYSAEDHVIAAGTDSYRFDVDGFLTEKTNAHGTSGYLYSSRGELLQVSTPDGRVISYDHDPFGRRIARRINGAIVEKYLWTGRTRLLAVYDGSDALVSRFTYVDSRMPVSMSRGGVTYYLMYDQVGSLRAVADSAGTVVKQVDYDSFGNIIADSNPSFDVPFGFAGGLHDRETGLVRFGFRDYDPELGRWTSKDPIDFAGGDVNLYRYVHNNPVNFIDPHGLYGRLVHYSLALQLALKAGFSPDEAHRIAAANQGVDEDPETGPWGIKGGPEWHFTSHEYALSKFNDVCSVEDLGMALHRLQDSYSHQGYKWYTGGHLRDDRTPDIYDPTSARDIQMRRETLRILNTYKKLGGM